jgi:hypothetical protein
MSASVLAIARVGHSHRRSNWVQTKRPTLTPFGIWTRDWNCHVFFVPKTMTFCWEAYSLKIVSFRYLWRVQVCSNTSIRIAVVNKRWTSLYLISWFLVVYTEGAYGMGMTASPSMLTTTRTSQQRGTHFLYMDQGG